MIHTRVRPLLLAVLALLVAGGAVGQSVTSLRGFGYPLIAADARTEILGGIGIGLQGLNTPFADPAAPAGLLRRGIVVSAAAVEQTAAFGDISEAVGSTRFPLISILFPVGDVVLTAGYGGYLDQSWAMTRTGSQPLGSGSVEFEDLIRATGGIGQARLGAAVPLGSRFAIGAAVGLHTGSHRIEFRRLFDTTSVGFVQSFTQARAVQYSGPTAQAGFRWDLIPEVRLGASVTWAGALSADSTAGTATSRDYDLPLQIAGGVSAYLAPSLLAAFSGRWSGWSVTDPNTAPDLTGATTTSRDTWEFGGGLELDDPERRTTRSYPLRVGFQYRELPFTFLSEAPREWLAGAGLGMRLGPDPSNPLARLDLTVQRGERTAAGNETTGDLTESMWRFGLSLSLFGN
jgi:hypothetical protein